MKRSPHETAILLAVVLKRHGSNRARISEKAVCLIANRPRIRATFVVALKQSLEDFGIILAELERGGFGLMYSESLSGAKCAGWLSLLTSDELEKPDFASLYAQVGIPTPDFEDD